MMRLLHYIHSTPQNHVAAFALLATCLLVACGVETFSGQVTEQPATLSRTPVQTSSQSGSPTLSSAPQATPTAVPSPGAVYHVDPSGSDSNDGSEAMPWRTIQHAVDSVGPGDTIMIGSGTYAGARIEQSGTVDAWMTLKAAPGAQVLINAPGPDNQHDSNLELENWEGDGVVAYWVIEGLEVANAPSWGIDMRGSEAGHSHHFIVRNNVVHDNGVESGRTGIFTAFVDDVVVENNESYGNGEHGVYLSNSGDRFVVRGNRLHDNVFCGLHMNGDASMGGDGLISNGLVEANVIYENGLQGCSGINMDGVTNSLVRNNLLYQNHAGGISLFQENGAACSRDNRVLHNTLVMAEDGRWAINLSDSSCVNNKLFNNIIVSLHEWRGSIVVPAPGIEGFESDYNVVLDRFSADDDNSVITLEEWQGHGYDEHSLIVTPETLFVGEDNFHLRSDSPAIDAGMALPDVPTDLEGNPRPSGTAPDIGALEFVAAESRQMLPTIMVAPEGAASGQEGTITYTYEGAVYRIAAREGATAENISSALDGLTSGTEDALLNVSPDGAWFLLESDRFDAECQGWACLSLVSVDASGTLLGGEAIRAGGQLLRGAGFSVVASGGELIIYPSNEGPHDMDLWAVRRNGDGWGPPLLLTGDSPYAWNHQPAISADRTQVVFDCGDEPYGGEGTAICEVGSDGAGFRVVLTPGDTPEGVPGGSALHHPDYAPDGSIVFEADWGGERIWRLPVGGAAPILVADVENDNSPCVLADGRIVSLWLGRPEGESIHEIKVMSADGSRFFVFDLGVDVLDAGIGCGAARP